MGNLYDNSDFPLLNLSMIEKRLCFLTWLGLQQTNVTLVHARPWNIASNFLISENNSEVMGRKAMSYSIIYFQSRKLNSVI